MQEVWRDIPKYEGLYQVSNCGQIRSLDRVVRGGYAGSYVRKGALKKQSADEEGYLNVCLYKDGKPNMFRVHRLVAEAFIPNPENKPEVNHKDSRTDNNCADNLEWCTRSENMLHAYDKGKATPHSKLSQARSISIEKRSIPVKCLELNRTFSSMAEAERITGVSIEMIRYSLRNNKAVYNKQYTFIKEGTKNEN